MNKAAADYIHINNLYLLNISFSIFESKQRKHHYKIVPLFGASLRSQSLKILQSGKNDLFLSTTFVHFLFSVIIFKFVSSLLTLIQDLFKCHMRFITVNVIFRCKTTYVVFVFFLKILPLNLIIRVRLLFFTSFPKLQFEIKT